MAVLVTVTVVVVVVGGGGGDAAVAIVVKEYMEITQDIVIKFCRAICTIFQLKYSVRCFKN